MKKIISLILALVLVLGLATIASAETVNGNAIFDSEKDNEGETKWDNANISTGEVKIMTTGDLTPVYRVDVEWKNLEFTYDFDARIWDPDTHTYSGTTGGWENSSIEDAIEITNHSNSAISYSATPVAENNTYNVTVSVAGDTGSLATAVGTEFDAAPSATMDVSVAGDPNDGGLDNFTLIYKINVTISPKN